MRCRAFAVYTTQTGKPARIQLFIQSENPRSSLSRSTVRSIGEQCHVPHKGYSAETRNRLGPQHRLFSVDGSYGRLCETFTEDSSRCESKWLEGVIPDSAAGGFSRGPDPVYLVKQSPPSDTRLSPKAKTPFLIQSSTKPVVFEDLLLFDRG
jgi:hypothetical protein